MSSTSPASEDPAPSAPGEAPDPSVLRAERRLRLLEELAEIGMDLARSLRPGALAGEAAHADASEAPVAQTARGKGRDPADAFGPLSRAIRLTLALEARTDAELRDLRAGLARARVEEQSGVAERARLAAAKAREDRVEQVRDLVLRAAEREIDDADAIEDLYEELGERLEDHEAELGCPERPLRETVAGLCKAFGLSPDWSRWTGDGWNADASAFRPFVSAITPSGPSLPEAAMPPGPAPPTPLAPLEGAHDLQ